MIAVPLWTAHLNTIYAGLLEYLAPSSFTIGSLRTDSYSVAIFSSKYEGAPRLLKPVTAIPFSLQNLNNFS